MKKLFISCFALSALIVACNNTQTTTTSNDSLDNASRAVSDTALATGNSMNADSNNTDFVNDAAAGGLFEVQLGNIAKTHASGQAVKDYAATIVRDHTKANAELKAIAAKNNFTIPTTLPDKLQMHIDHLSGENGAEFDKDYISMMVDDHQDDIKSFEKCAKSDKENADVKAFAAKTLPALYKHLDAAKKIKESQK
jgi:putative membrane protein